MKETIGTVIVILAVCFGVGSCSFLKEYGKQLAIVATERAK